MKYQWIYGFTAMGLFASCNKMPKPASETKPNIIFILADDLGYGDLGCYGQKVIKTPNLDRMAAEGIRFTHHYAGSTVSAPSRCCLMTGKHTGHARVRGNTLVPLQEGDTTIAELLLRAGYHTALIGKWGLGEAGTSGIPNRKGFEYFFGYLNQVHAHNSYPDYLWRDTSRVMLNNGVILKPASRPETEGGVASQKNDYSNALFTDEALRYIRTNSKNPFFLYLAYTIPHANNEALELNSIPIEIPSPGEYANTSWPEQEKAKAAAISYLDKDVGRIISLLKELGIDKNTIVFFSSDNGPHQEGVNPEFFNSNGPLYGIKRDLYEGGIRVPLIVWAPALIAQGKVSSHVSAFWDFLPTACELAGIPVPAWTDGISFVPALMDKEQKQHEYLYWEFYEQGGKQAVLIPSGQKAIRLNMTNNPDAPLLFYHIFEDPHEQNGTGVVSPEEEKLFLSIMAREHVPSAEFMFEYEKKKEEAH